MKRLLTLYLIHSACLAFAQQKAIDSLQQELKNFDATKLELRQNLLPSEGDTTKVNMLNALGRQYLQVSDYGAARTYADDALTIAQQIGYKNGIAQSYNSIGITYWYLGNYTEALNNYFAALKIKEEIGDKDGIATAYGNIGTIYGQQGNYPEALKYYFASLKIFEETEGDKNRIASSYSNIGVIYDSQSNYPEALKYFFAALKIFEETSNKNGIALCYNNIGVIFRAQGNYPEALKYSFAALRISEEMGDKQSFAFYKNNIGIIYFLQNNYSEALEYQLAALKIFEEIGDKNGIASSSISIGNNKLKMHAAKEGRDWLLKGLMLAKEISTLENIKGSYEGLAAADSALGNYKDAYNNHKLFIRYRDSLYNEEVNKKSLQTKMQYEFDKKQVADSIGFVQEKRLAAVKLQKQKAITYGGFGGIAITIVLLFFVYRNYSKQRIANKKLKEAQEQLIKSEKMAAFGMMASRVSHEIQNPLNFVNNFSDLAEEMVNDIVKLNSEQERSETAKDLINNLQKIKHHGKRADAIVKQLQEHTNKGTAHEYFEPKQPG